MGAFGGAVFADKTCVNKLFDVVSERSFVCAKEVFLNRFKINELVFLYYFQNSFLFNKEGITGN